MSHLDVRCACMTLRPDPAPGRICRATDHAFRYLMSSARGRRQLAPIIDEKNLQSAPIERRRQGPPVRSIASVPVEDQNGDAARGATKEAGKAARRR